MQVRELIEKLQQYPANSRVIFQCVRCDCLYNIDANQAHQDVFSARNASAHEAVIIPCLEGRGERFLIDRPEIEQQIAMQVPDPTASPFYVYSNGLSPASLNQDTSETRRRVYEEYLRLTRQTIDETEDNERS